MILQMRKGILDSEKADVTFPTTLAETGPSMTEAINGRINQRVEAIIANDRNNLSVQRLRSFREPWNASGNIRSRSFVKLYFTCPDMPSVWKSTSVSQFRMNGSLCG